MLTYELLHGYTPFSEEGTLEEPLEIYRRVTFPDTKVGYSPRLPSAAASFIKRLLRRNPATRLGSARDEEVRALPCTRGIII